MASGVEKENIIAPEGDLVLIVGEAQVKLLVASAILSSASKVFKALLGPRFKEGQTHGSTGQPKAITFPEDNTQAMLDMVRVLHNQVDDSFIAPSGDRVLDLAVVIDKYDCAKSVKLQSYALLMGAPLVDPASSFTDCAKAALAAYLLRSPFAFRMLCARAIMQADRPFNSIGEASWAKLFPANLLSALEHKRNTVQQKVIFDLPVVGVAKCAAQCSISEVHHTDMLCKAFKVPFWPPQFAPRGTLTLFTALHTIVGLERMSVVTACSHSSRTKEVHPSAFKAFANDIQDECTKLCMGCILQGKMDFMDECKSEEHRAEFKVLY